MELKTVNKIFCKEQKLISSKLLTMNENPEINEFVLILGFEDGDFFKFKMKFMIKKLKEKIKSKQIHEDYSYFFAFEVLK